MHLRRYLKSSFASVCVKKLVTPVAHISDVFLGEIHKSDPYHPQIFYFLNNSIFDAFFK